MKNYRITLTEEQLRLVINAIEDWHRFIAGDCGMSNALSLLEYHRDASNALKNVERFITDLPSGSSYGWNGSMCENKHQRKAIAMSYMLYREPLHYLTIHNGKDMSWNVYNGETLTCPEQGPLVKIEEIEQ